MSNRGDLLRVRARFRETQAKQETRLNRFLALMGDGAGNLAVAGSPLFVYVRVQGRGVAECLNTVAPLRNDLPIIVGYDFKKPDTLQVLSIYEGGMSSFGPYAYLPAHHQAHEFRNANGGDDVVWIQKQAVLPLLCRPTSPTSMFVEVLEDNYPWLGAWNLFPGATSADLTARIPALPGDARFVLIYVDGATNVLGYSNGAIFPAAWPPATAFGLTPAPPAGTVPVASVYLPNGITAIDWANIYDVRLFNQPIGGSVTPGPHALLDTAVHSDTVTNTPPARGSLTVANAAPAWDELVHPGGAGYALTTDATDVIWDQTPTWTGAHTFNAGLVIGAGQGITLPDPGWIGIGPAASRLTMATGVPDVAEFIGFGQVNVENVLGHIGDPDTYLIFSPDFAGFRVGGVDFLYMDENGVDEFEVNPGGVDLDFIVQAVAVPDALLVQGSDGQITLGALGAGFVKSTGVGVLSTLAEVALHELASYVRGSIIRGGAADWEAYALAGAAGYALISTAADIVWDQTPAWTGEHSFAAGIAFTGASGANEITVPDNIAIALELLDAGGLEYMRIVSTNANPYFLIDPAGAGIDVGVGIAIPLALLHIERDQNATTEFRINNSTTGVAARSIIRLETDADNAGMQFEQLSTGYTAAGARKSGATVLVAGRPGGLSLVADNAAGDIRLYTGGTTDADEHATLLDNGYFGLDVQPSYRLDVKDDVAGYVANFFNDGGALNRYGLRVQAGHDNPATVGTTYWFYCLDGDASEAVGCLKSVDGVFQLADLSDEARKTNIEDTKVVGLEIINGLKVRDFNWKTNPKGPVMTSFIAQEAQKVYPDMVGEFEDGTLGTSRAILIPVLVKAMQEIDTRLTQLEVT